MVECGLSISHDMPCPFASKVANLEAVARGVRSAVDHNLHCTQFALCMAELVAALAELDKEEQ